ncbi:MAG: HPr family phosphocarrier protein [Candidatus Omnitrophica bacterium]|nr:HPr family phosphocarrier protein [Candidatus Omnitrophota bacterium]
MKTIEKKLIIRDTKGLHVRPASLFVQIAKKFKSNITVKKGKDAVDGKSIMGMMTLALAKGSQVTITAQGEDAEEALEELENFIKRVPKKEKQAR